MMGQRRSFSRLLAPPAHLRQALPLLLALCCLVTMISACSVQSGGDLLAFERDGQLFFAASDGSGLRMISKGDIVSGAWSPDHHQFVFRAGPSAFSAASSTELGGTLGAPDAVSDLYVASVSGGLPLRVTPDANAFARSDAWWNPNGNRLLYREEYNASGTVPVYFVSQDDQPVGIARKAVADIVSVPVLSPDGSQVAGIDATGNLRIGAPSQQGKVLAKGLPLSLPGSNRPTRVLWQPHANALLYPTVSVGGTTLFLQGLGGTVKAIGAVPKLVDMAFSPDGKHLLVRTPQDFQLWPVGGASQPTWRVTDADPLALPWWSPDGSQLLLQDHTGWRLVNAATGAVTPLLSATPNAPTQATSSTRWSPAAGSPWSPDGMHAVFVSVATAKWQGHALTAPKGAAGLYVARIGGAASGEQPLLIASGNVRSPTWSYLDPSTVFLIAA